MPNYKCTNFGQCVKADKQELIEVAPGAEPFCPECEKELKRAAGGAAPGSPLLKIAIPVVLLLLGLGAFFLLRKPEPEVVAPPAAENVVRLNGSDTVAKAARLLAEGYTKAKIEVQGRGSATGFTCLADRSCDIGMSSRKIKPDEVEALKSLGDMTSNQAEQVIGLDLVVAAVHPSWPVGAVTEATVNTKLCGIPRGGNLYLRAPGSGTLDLVQARAACSFSANYLDSNAALDAKIAMDPEGFGLLSRTAVVKSKAMPIGATTDLRQSTEADPWTRRLYFYVPPNASEAAKEFAEYARSQAAQALLEKAGFVGQTPEVVPPPALPTNPPPPPEYAGLSTSADRVTIDLRFRLSSSELDSKSMDDLGRIVEILKNTKYAGRHVVLIGFADSSGTEAGNVKLSKDRAATVEAELKRRGIAAAVVTGFGQAMPVAPNGTEEGRQKNRRVEVWLRR